MGDGEHDWMTQAALDANPDDHEFKGLRTSFANKQLAKKVNEAVEAILSKAGAKGEPAPDSVEAEEEPPTTTGLDAGGGTAPRTPKVTTPGPHAR